MKRPLLALAAAAALVAANGCGWQVQNMRGNHCVDGGDQCSACGAAGIGGGQLAGRVAGRVRHGPFANALRAQAQSGPPHVQGDFLTGLRSLHAQDAAPPVYQGPSPTVTYPYYTVRGPRDFLMDDPMPIGY